MKSILLTALLLLLMIGSTFGQDQTVTLTTTGQGETLEEARSNALRTAIEQAFGAFISTRTEIVNDDLIRDEIISIASGNILNYRIVNELELRENLFTSTVFATVSVSNLTNYARGKGIEIEFEGSLFAFNVNQQKLNEENEVKALRDVIPVFQELASKAYDYTITAESPIRTLVIERGRQEQEAWKVPLNIEIAVNNNFGEIGNLLSGVLSGLSLSLEEAETYRKMNKNVYPATLVTENNGITYSILRTSEGRDVLYSLITSLGYYPLNFTVKNGLSEFGFGELQEILFDYSGERGGRALASKIRPLARRGFPGDPIRDDVYYFDDSRYLIIYPDFSKGFYFNYASMGYRWSYNSRRINFFLNIHQEQNLEAAIDNGWNNELIFRYPIRPSDVKLGIENRRRVSRLLSRQDVPEHIAFKEFSGSILDEVSHWNENLSDGMDSLLEIEARQRNKTLLLGPVYNLNKSGKVIEMGFPQTLMLDELRQVTGFEIRPGAMGKIN